VVTFELAHARRRERKGNRADMVKRHRLGRNAAASGMEKPLASRRWEEPTLGFGAEHYSRFLATCRTLMEPGLPSVGTRQKPAFSRNSRKSARREGVPERNREWLCLGRPWGRNRRRGPCERVPGGVARRRLRRRDARKNNLFDRRKYHEHLAFGR